MIPKIIHYCWFGKTEKSDTVLTCISSWKRNMPQYSFIEWNESNFDVNHANPYVYEAYKAKKWAFVSDYVRVYALSTYGGIYFDTDVEVYKCFDALLDNNDAFVGFESNDYVGTSVIASNPQTDFLKEFLEYYDSISFDELKSGINTKMTNVKIVTRILCKRGLIRNGRMQKIQGMAIYPQYYFASNDLINIFGWHWKKNYSFHHCEASWKESKRKDNWVGKIRHYLIGKARNLFGTDCLSR